MEPPRADILVSPSIKRRYGEAAMSMTIAAILYAAFVAAIAAAVRVVVIERAAVKHLAAAR
jgi:hypothetical protein